MKRLLCLFLCILFTLTLLPPASAAEKVRVETFGGHEYDLISGTYYAVESDQGCLPFYYSDGFFEEAPQIFNEHLATMSINTAIASIHSGSYSYFYRHWPIRQLFADIGCDEESIHVNAESLAAPEEHSIAFAFGQKPLTYHSGELTGYTLIPIAIRSAGYDLEWVDNFTVGASGEAQGFGQSADKVCAELKEYLEKYDLADAAASGKVKFWTSGHSRGGAVANLVAKRLVDEYGPAVVYSYAWEAPAGGYGTNSDKYNGLHSCINRADLIPYVAPEKMGFLRYGKTHYFPSEDKELYETERAAMLRQLNVIDKYSDFSDDFSLAAINIESLLSGEIIQSIDYDPGISANAFTGQYMKLLIDKFVDWGVKNRKNYVAAPFRLNGHSYDGLEKSLSRLAGIFFNMSSSRLNRLADKAMEIELSEADIADLLVILEGWNYSGIPVKADEATREKIIFKYWDKFLATGIFETDILTKEEQAIFVDAWPAAADALLSFISYDFNTPAALYGYDHVYSTLVVIATIVKNADLVTINHVSSNSLAWARSYDSYYSDAPDESYLPYASVDAPSATCGGVQLSTDISTPTTVRLHQKILLDVPGRKGETFCYKIKNLTTGEFVLSDALYENGIALPAQSGGGTYSISVEVMSWGRRNSRVFYVTVPEAFFINGDGISEKGIKYRVSTNRDTDAAVMVIAAAYDDRQLAGVAVSEVFTAEPGIYTGVIPITYDPNFTYSLFVVNAATYAPLCPEWIQ